MSEIDLTKLLVPPLPEGDPNKPFFSFDFDGVICRPPLGENPTLGRKLYSDELPENIRRIDANPTSFMGLGRRRLQGVVESLKYFGRGMMPQAREGLEAISQHRNLVIITGRNHLARGIVEAWLKRYNLNHYFLGIYANFTDQRTRKFKLHLLRGFGISEHADDDGSITHYLATHHIKQLYLRDWRWNAGLPYPDNVYHFMDIAEIARHIERGQESGVSNTDTPG